MIRWMKEIQYKVISSVNNAVSSGHVAPTTLTEAAQSLILACTTAYFKV